MIRAIVFDFGNVVAFFDHRLGLRKLIEHTDLSVEEMHDILIGADLEHPYERGHMTTQQFLDAFLRLCSIRCAPEVLGDALADVFKPNRAVCDLLPPLASQCDLYLLSNTNDNHARWFLRQFEQELQPFRGLILSHEVGARKPEPAIYRHAQQLAGVAPEEMIFIDDLEANVEGARACGWKGIVYTDPETLQQQLREHGVILEEKERE